MPKASRKLDPVDLVRRFAREMRRLRLRVRQAPAELRADEAGAPEHQITVALIPAAQVGLGQLQARTNLSKTDLANRAITTYEFLDAQLRAGYELIIQDNTTGETRRVDLL
jgi:hypothetical protein